MSFTQPIISCNQFNPTDMTITNIYNGYTPMKNAYIKYQFKPNTIPQNLIFQTSDIKLTNYGISKLGDFAKEDKHRRYIKVPLDINQSACLEFRSMLEKIDKHILSKQKDIFGEKSTLYKYVPLVRKPTELEGEELEEKKMLYFKHQKKDYDKTHPCYCKVYIDTEYDYIAKVKTKIYDSTNNKSINKINIDTITELYSKIQKNSTIKMIIMIDKLWIFDLHSKYNPATFGISIKCINIYIKEYGFIKYKNNQIKFVESDELDESDEYEIVLPDRIVKKCGQLLLQDEDSDKIYITL